MPPDEVLTPKNLKLLKKNEYKTNLRPLTVDAYKANLCFFLIMRVTENKLQIYVI